MKINRILVPTDFSDYSQSALVYALWIADNHNAEIILLHVVLPGMGDLDVPVISAGETIRRVKSAEEIMEILLDASRNSLLAKYKSRNRPRITFDVRVGSPVHELVLSSNENEIDVVVMGTRGKHNRLDDFFGSITTSVLRKLKIPVFVIPESFKEPAIRAVGFATDLDPCDAIQIWRAGQILAPFNPIMHIVHVRTSEEKSHALSLDELKEFLGGRPIALNTQFHEITGDKIEENLRAFADENRLDLLAFHSPKRNLFERLGHHSVSRNLALFSNMPLLSVP